MTAVGPGLMISGPYRGRQTRRRRALYEILHGLELEGCLHVLPGAVLQSLNALEALWTQAINWRPRLSKRTTAFQAPALGSWSRWQRRGRGLLGGTASSEAFPGTPLRLSMAEWHSRCGGEEGVGFRHRLADGRMSRHTCNIKTIPVMSVNASARHLAGRNGTVAAGRQSG